MAASSAQPMKPSKASAPVSLSEKSVLRFLDAVKRKEHVLLGKGSFGAVYEVKYRGKRCAMKVGFKKRDEFGDSGEDVLRAEIRMMLKSFGSSHCVQCLAYSLADAHPPLLLLEWADGGDLTKSGKRTLDQTFDAMEQVFDGLHRLHKRHIVHFDIKPENILLKKSGQVRIADFGFADDHADASKSLGSETSGSPGYEAPELRCKRRSQRTLGLNCTKVDVFSAGMTFLDLLSKHKEFKEVAKSAVNKAYDEMILDLRSDLQFTGPAGKQLRSFFRSVMAKDPRRRCSAMQAKKLTKSLRKAVITKK